MADATINDLSARTSLAAADVFEVDNTSSADDSEKATFALMGGLIPVAKTVADGNYTAASGDLVLYDASGASEKVTSAPYFDADGTWTYNSEWQRDTTNEWADVTGATNAALTQVVSVTNGTVYVVRFRIPEYTSGNVTVSLNGGTAVAITEAVQEYQVLVTAGNADTLLSFNGSSYLGAIDAVSVVEYMAVTMPATPQAGERVMVKVTGEDAVGSVHILTGSGDTLDSVDVSAYPGWVGGPLCRLGESLTNFATSASAWVIETDGRKPMSCKIDASGGSPQSNMLNNVTAVITIMDNEVYDNGNISNEGQSGIQLRRSGTYLLNGGVISGASETGDVRVVLKDAGLSINLAVGVKEYASSLQLGGDVTSAFAVDVDVFRGIVLMVRPSVGGDTFDAQAGSNTYLEAIEQL